MQSNENLNKYFVADSKLSAEDVQAAIELLKTAPSPAKEDLKLLVPSAMWAMCIADGIDPKNMIVFDSMGSYTTDEMEMTVDKSSSVGKSRLIALATGIGKSGLTSRPERIRDLKIEMPVVEPLQEYDKYTPSKHHNGKQWADLNKKKKRNKAAKQSRKNNRKR